MPIRQLLHLIVGMTVFLTHTERREHREDRGLSQSAENAILLAGAVTIATS